MTEESGDAREFDMILWGATGFVGRLVAEYLAGPDGAGDLDWAIAGRNRDKLESLREELVDHGDVGELPIIVGDANNQDSLDAMAARTRVVCTTVGPYARYGTGLVEACVDHGTDYCDLTGEVHWVRQMIDRYHHQAEESGARIVHFCGFDSIPSDLGTLMVQEKAREDWGATCKEVKFFLMGASGGFSGGTIESMANLMTEASEDPSIMKVLGDPYGLNPQDERSGSDGGVQTGPRYDEDIDRWTGPFFMAPVNEKVVRRSNALRGWEYGGDFRYAEASAFGDGVGGALAAGGFTAGSALFNGAMALGPTRRMLQKFVLPEPGEGPSRDAIENGYFKVTIVGKGVSEKGHPFRVEGTVAADRDPGYGATATMLGESALCLALDGPEDPRVAGGGVLTPASAMGMALVDRLRGVGLTFDVT
jgi:short subunit dehydrogenase-like uncharacterized protein